MPRALSEYECSQKLNRLGVTLLHYGGSASRKSKFKDISTGYEWEATAKSVFVSGGSPCAGKERRSLSKRVTEEDAFCRMSAIKDVTMVYYAGSVGDKRSRFKDNGTGIEWCSPLRDVLNGGRNPATRAERVGKSQSLSYNEAFERMKSIKGITMIEYGGSCESISTFRDDVTGDLWKTRLSCILKGHGNPFTKAKRLSNKVSTPLEKALKLMEAVEGITLLKYGGNLRKKSIFKDDVTGDVWSTSLSIVLRGSRNPLTRKGAPLSSKEAFERMSKIEGISMLEYGGCMLSKSKFKDNLTGDMWYTSLKSVLMGSRNPNTSKPAFKVNKPAYFYSFDLMYLGVPYTCFGITANLEERMYAHIRSIARNVDNTVTTLKPEVYYFEKGSEAKLLESCLKSSEYCVGIPNLKGFKTEAILQSHKSFLDGLLEKFEDMKCSYKIYGKRK